MAKKSKAPAGVAAMTEAEVMEMIKQSPKSSTMKQLIKQLREQSNVNSTESKPIEVTPKSQVIADNQAKQRIEMQTKKADENNAKILESDADLIKVEEKLTSVVEKLIGVFEKSISKGVGPVTPTARAQELVDSKKLDYRTIGERFKDKIFGRGGVDEKTGKRLGNKFDPNSLRYKFGTLKGLAETTGLVKPGSTGFIANALAVREERLQKTEAGSDLDRRRSKTKLEGEVAESQAASGRLQDAEARINVKRQAGYSDQELAATTRGKKMFQARNAAADEVIANDPTLKQEAKANEAVRKTREAEATKPRIDNGRSVPFAGPLKDSQKANVEEVDENKRQMDEQTDLLKKIEENTRGDKAKTKDKKEDKEEGKGGVLSRLTSKLGNMDSKLVRGGKGMLGRGATAVRGASMLSGLGGAAAVGEGAAGGLLAAAAPWLLGTAAVGAVGYLGYKGYQAWKKHKAEKAAQANISKEKDKSKLAAMADSAKTDDKEHYQTRMDTSDPNHTKYMLNGKEITADEYLNIANADEKDIPKLAKQALAHADQVSSSSAENAGMKDRYTKEGDKTLVNAPTTIQKVNQNTYGKRPARNSDWYDSRYRHRAAYTL